MQKIGSLRRGLTLIELLVCVAMFIILVFLVRGCAGCGENAVPAAQSSLPSRLAGEWISTDEKNVKAFFSNGTNKLVFRTYREDTYDFTSESEHTIAINSQRSKGQWRDAHEPFKLVIEIEFLSDNEFVAIFPTDAGSCPPHLKGRFRRTTPLPPKATPPDASPVAVAKEQVERIAQKLKRVESLRGGAAQERDDMVGKLRELGVESAADLKRNPRALRMAENLAKLAAEIEGMDSQLATIDTELLKARSIARRIEREQAGISDDEMRQLSAQLRDAEARTDAAPTPITPLDVDAAVESAMKARKAAPRDKR